jgi:hypothetical protein
VGTSDSREVSSQQKVPRQDVVMETSVRCFKDRE